VRKTSSIYFLWVTERLTRGCCGAIGRTTCVYRNPRQDRRRKALPGHYARETTTASSRRVRALPARPVRPIPLHVYSVTAQSLNAFIASPSAQKYKDTSSRLLAPSWI
jgi:hypothetical protein